jgi:DNA-binding phage protein
VQEVVETIAVELVRALRGRRSAAELSRRAGYASNVVHRWEGRKSWPTAARYLALHRRLRPGAPSWIESFFHTQPAWAVNLDPCSPRAVAAFLQHLKGKTPVLRIAEHTGTNRYTVARWLDGSSEPRLPDFLRLVDASSRRLLDLVAALEDPLRLPSVRDRWAQLQLAREAAYDVPWSHGVLRALEIPDAPRGPAAQVAWIARQLGVSGEEVRQALRVLEATAQVTKSRAGYRVKQIMVIDTGRDARRAHELKVAWTTTALERMRANAPGRFGYSLFAVSRADLSRLHGLHLQYVRAMQDLVAASRPSECVGLYCAQLLDLSGEPVGAFAEAARGRTDRTNRS